MRLLFIAVIGLGMLSLAQAKEFSSSAIQPSRREFQGRKEDISKPAPIGAFHKMSKGGLQVINPWAPASAGYAKDNVTQPMRAEGGVANPEETQRQAGGVILIGYAF